MRELLFCHCKVGIRCFSKFGFGDRNPKRLMYTSCTAQPHMKSGNICLFRAGFSVFCPDWDVFCEKFTGRIVFQMSSKKKSEIHFRSLDNSHALSPGGLDTQSN